MDELLNAPWAVEYSARMGREYVKKVITEVLDGIRSEISKNSCHRGTEALSELAASRAATLLQQKSSSTLKAVVNATGVVIHTNLGRAPLAKEALDAVDGIAGTYSTLEYSPEKGGREGRNTHIEWLICRISGAEAALVVNNNAAAVLLALSATATGREVIVSNGELVEIGDSFRIPEILSFSGARMIAVGCTNSTRISDYSNAVTENTTVLLKVHPSTTGFPALSRPRAAKNLKSWRLRAALCSWKTLAPGSSVRLVSPLAVLNTRYGTVLKQESIS